MTRRFKTKLAVGFPMLSDKLKAEDYWRSVNRHDLIPRMDQVVAEFRAHHDAQETMSPAWPKVWTTWYVRAVRFIPKPKGTFEPRGGGTRSRPAFRAQTEEETTVPLSMVRELAEKLRTKSSS